MLDSKLQKLKDHFGISTATDWQGVRPEWIVAIDGCGRPVSIVLNITTPDVQGFQRSQSQVAAQVSRALSRGQRNR